MTITQTTRPAATLGRTLARSLATGLAVFGIGAGLTLYVTAWPVLERPAALADLAAFAFLALLLWGAWRARTMTEQQAHRVAVIGCIIFAAVGAYAVAVVLGIMPAAPWSPLG